VIFKVSLFIFSLVPFLHHFLWLFSL